MSVLLQIKKSWLSGFIAVGVKAMQTSTLEDSKQSKDNPDNVLNILLAHKQETRRTCSRDC